MSQHSNETQQDNRLNAQVQYLFLYGEPNIFSNVLKRDASLSGDVAEDLEIIVANWVDFILQMGYEPNLVEMFVKDYLSNFIEDDDDVREYLNENQGELFTNNNETSDSLDSINKNKKIEVNDEIIKIGDNAYEDVDDIVSDDHSFDKFIEQFNSTDNTIFRKIVFRSFLKDTLGV